MKRHLNDEELDKFIKLNSHMHSILERINLCRREMEILEQLYDLNRNEMIKLLESMKEAN